MKITEEVIQDLLPLYLAGEASADTTKLVKNYFEMNPEFAKFSEQTIVSDLSNVPKPLAKEVEMEAYKKANKLMVVRTLVLATLLAVIFLSTLLIVPLIYLRIF